MTTSRVPVHGRREGEKTVRPRLPPDPPQGGRYPPQSHWACVGEPRRRADSDISDIPERASDGPGRGFREKWPAYVASAIRRLEVRVETRRPG